MNSELLHSRLIRATLCRPNVLVACRVSAFSLVRLPTREGLSLLLDSSTLFLFRSIMAPWPLLFRTRQAPALSAEFTLSAAVVVNVASAPRADVGRWGTTVLRLVMTPFPLLVTVSEKDPFMFLSVENLLRTAPVVRVLMGTDVLMLVVIALFASVLRGLGTVMWLIFCNARTLGVMLQTLVMKHFVTIVMVMMVDIVMAMACCATGRR